MKMYFTEFREDENGVAGVERSEPPELVTWGLVTRTSWLDPSHPGNP